MRIAFQHPSTTDVTVRCAGTALHSRRQSWSRAATAIGAITLLLIIPVGCAHAADETVKSGGSASAGESAQEGLGATIGTPGAMVARDRSPAWALPGTRILLTGVIYREDGKTPASDVVLYYYHTNSEGRYIHKPEEPRSVPPNEKGQTHGFIRGWVRTGADGSYAIETTRPGPYPGGDEPAHVHATILEPGVPEYWIDDFVFDDDPLLTTAKRRQADLRGGGGVVRLARQGDTLVGERDITLGQNIPDHPRPVPVRPASGPQIGADVVSFTPRHAFGADRGTSTCPMCKYGWYSGILYFVAPSADWSELKQWLIELEKEGARRSSRLRIFLVYGSATAPDGKGSVDALAQLGEELDLKHVALTFVPSLDDQASDLALNRVDPARRNTFVIYRRSRVVDQAVDLAPTPENIARVTERLDRSENEYFAIPKG